MKFGVGNLQLKLIDEFHCAGVSPLVYMMLKLNFTDMLHKTQSSLWFTTIICICNKLTFKVNDINKTVKSVFGKYFPLFF